MNRRHLLTRTAAAGLGVWVAGCGSQPERVGFFDLYGTFDRRLFPYNRWHFAGK